MKPFKSDCHIHSRFSPDGRGTEPEAVVAAALGGGLDGICFTDHCECNDNSGVPPQFARWPDLDHEEYYKATSALKGKYPLKISVGIELGQPNNKRHLADKLIADNCYEFVLGSIHNLKNNLDFSLFDYKKLIAYPELIDNLFNRYLNDLKELARIDYVDCITHVTYVLRYIQASGNEYDLTPFYPEYEELFKRIIANGKALEINTSNLRRGFGTTMPGEDLIKLYAELGGKNVTVGSDAHRANEIGSGIEQGYALANKYGLKIITDINELY